MKKQSRILAEVHADARDLFRSGGIDKKTMREYDALCLPRAREISPKQIRHLRARAQQKPA